MSRLLLRFVLVIGALCVVAAAPNPFVLGAGMVIVGIGLSGGNPATNRLISVHLAPGDRGVAMGIIKDEPVPYVTLIEPGWNPA